MHNVQSAITSGKGSGKAPAVAASGAKAALNLPFEPVTLTFNDLHYFVPTPKGSGELELLKGIYGVFRPGVLTALMGASGAGALICSSALNIHSIRLAQSFALLPLLSQTVLLHVIEAGWNGAFRHVVDMHVLVTDQVCTCHPREAVQVSRR